MKCPNLHERINRIPVPPLLVQSGQASITEALEANNNLEAGDNNSTDADNKREKVRHII